MIAQNSARECRLANLFPGVSICLRVAGRNITTDLYSRYSRDHLRSWVNVKSKLHVLPKQVGSISSISREITLAFGYCFHCGVLYARCQFAASIWTTGFVKLPINVNASNNSSKLCSLWNDVPREQTDTNRIVHGS